MSTLPPTTAAPDQALQITLHTPLRVHCRRTDIGLGEESDRRHAEQWAAGFRGPDQRVVDISASGFVVLTTVGARLRRGATAATVRFELVHDGEEDTPQLLATLCHLEWIVAMQQHEEARAAGDQWAADQAECRMNALSRWQTPPR